VKIDGRKLSHAQLEAMRFQAVKAVQAGQPPTAVVRELGLYNARGARHGGIEHLHQKPD
jgi:hypothetical protein